MTEKQKQWIDTASVEQLLRRWRNAPLGDELLMGAAGEYFAKVLRERRDAQPEAFVAASKAIGWAR